MEAIEEELEETRVGEGCGEEVALGSGAGVSVSAGEGRAGVVVAKDSVEVETAAIVGVDCGCKTFTWNEQALVNSKRSTIKILFIE